MNQKDFSKLFPFKPTQISFVRQKGQKNLQVFINGEEIIVPEDSTVTFWIKAQDNLLSSLRSIKAK